MSTAIVTVLFVVLAQAELGSAWMTALINYGALGLWVIYLVARDYTERGRQDKRHEDNLAAQREVRDSLRAVMDLLIVGIGGMKSMDTAYVVLLEKLKTNNDGHK